MFLVSLAAWNANAACSSREPKITREGILNKKKEQKREKRERKERKGRGKWNAGFETRIRENGARSRSEVQSRRRRRRRKQGEEEKIQKEGEKKAGEWGQEPRSRTSRKKRALCPGWKLYLLESSESLEK